MSLLEQWLAAVDKKNTVLCAGLDPAEWEMGRGAKGLPQGTSKLGWAIAYIDAVAPYCVAIKPNTQYWKSIGDAQALIKISERARDHGLLVIHDSKLADIGDTNDAGIYAAASAGAHAVTIAPYAGNMKETADFARKRGIDVITMCLMSNPEYKQEKNMWVNISELETNIDPLHIQLIEGSPHAKRYHVLADQAKRSGVLAIVIGAPSSKNHITAEEVQLAEKYAGSNMLVLCPGVGAQGGEADLLFKTFGSRAVMVNVGRALMQPEGRTQAEAAKYFRDSLNEARG